MSQKSVILFSAAFFVLWTITQLFFSSKNKPTFDKEDLKLFIAFKDKFKKNYASFEELVFRQRIFFELLKKIKSHNANPEKTYTLGINQFSDLTKLEKRNFYLSKRKISNDTFKCERAENFPLDFALAPQEIDWSTTGKVQQVKSQGQCDSGWAFAASGALESAYAISQNSQPPDISEQELIDCSWDLGNFGCNGGLAGLAFDYILGRRVNSQSRYPYIGNDQDCDDSSAGKGIYKLSGCVKVPSSIAGLVAAIAKQPVAVALFASDEFFQYSGGIFNPEKCEGDINHAFLAVGYKIDGELAFVKGKNSWGVEWGEQGFFRIAMGEGSGTCGMIASGQNYYPLVDF